ncbi:MAG: hypothetical protein ABEI52_03525, partial [Halobacteriaceae archaeon]
LLVVIAWHLLETHRRMAVDRIRRSRLLSGADAGRTRLAVRGIVALTLLFTLVFAIAGVLGRSLSVVIPFDAVMYGPPLLGMAAAVHAYWNQGLLVCVVIAGAPVVSLGGYLVAGGMPILGAIGYPVLLSAVAGAIIGSIGFGIGMFLRRVQMHVWDRSNIGDRL